MAQTAQNGSGASHGVFQICNDSRSALYHAVAFMVVNVPLVLPLCLYILRLGLRQWRSGAKTGHTDVFTYNIVISQLISFVGFAMLCVNDRIKNKLLTIAAIYLFFLNSSTVMYFQLTTALDRYMAVVHPVVYLRLKSQTFTLIRNVCCAIIWLHCLIESLVFLIWTDTASYLLVAGVSFSIAVILVLFCNLRVACVLVRPGPGDGGNGNQSKRRAFYMITTITGTLLLKFGGDLFSLSAFTFSEHGENLSCALFLSSIWFNLPSTLFLPLLFLHRKEKIPCFKTNK